MELCCTRPTCPRPRNRFPELDDSATLNTASQRYCITCGMPQILAGRYLPLKLLGRGGFGAAFLAIDRYTPAKRQCVVKQFQPSGSLTSDQLQLAQRLFEREAEVLESLGSRHPQIPNLLAFFELDMPSRTPGKREKFFYLVQEYIDGKNMEELLEQQGAMSEASVTQMMEAILKVLKFVHDNHSIHRDIKPSNIMQHRNGEYFLLDFGAVKQVTTTASIAGQPPARSTGIYSRGFAPPEQMSGSVVYPATDLYALAVTCITLLTGKQPHDLFDPLNNGFHWRLHTQVSDRLAAILNRLLLPAPNQRFQSAEQVLDALQSSSDPPPCILPQPQPAQSPHPPSSCKVAKSTLERGFKQSTSGKLLVLREQAQQFGAKFAKSLTNQMNQPIVFHLHGIGGVGKTTLLQDLQQENAQKARFVWVTFDFGLGVETPLKLMVKLYEEVEKVTKPGFWQQEVFPPPDPFKSLYQKYQQTLHSLETQPIVRKRNRQH